MNPFIRWIISGVMALVVTSYSVWAMDLSNDHSLLMLLICMVLFRIYLEDMEKDNFNYKQKQTKSKRKKKS